MQSQYGRNKNVMGTGKHAGLPAWSEPYAGTYWNIQPHGCEKPASEGLQHQREDKNRVHLGGNRSHRMFLLHNES